MYLPAPRGLANPEAVRERLDLLATEPRVQPLRAWAAEVVERRRPKLPNIVIPHFDPAEAGVEARVLLLFEAPGPKTVPEWGGSGFVSVDNNDLTAQNVWTARNDVGLHEHVLAWNINPWVLGRADVKPTADELGQGASELRRLLTVLPELRVVIASGKKAQAGWDRHVAPFVGEKYVAIHAPHPAGQSFAQTGNRERFVRSLERAVRLAG